MGRRWTLVSAAAVVVVLSAVAAPVVAVEAPAYGASLGPSPLIVEDWAHPFIAVTNIGRVSINATVSIAGDGYRLAGPTSFTALGPGEHREVPLAAVGPGSAVATAYVTNDVGGTDRANLRINVNVRHLTLIDEAARSLPAVVGGVAGLGALLLLVALAVGRRLRRRRSA